MSNWKVAFKEPADLTLEIDVFNSLRVNRTLTLHLSEAKMVCKPVISNLGTTPQEVVMVEDAAFQGSPDIKVSAPEQSRFALYLVLAKADLPGVSILWACRNDSSGACFMYTH